MDITPSTIWTGDNLAVMRAMPDAFIDLIYLDPPFCSKALYKGTVGSKAEKASFNDNWYMKDVDKKEFSELAEDYPALHEIVNAGARNYDESMKAYLIFMSLRLIEIQRILKDTGSVYLHVDPTASHYLKLVMDAIFGKDSFRNEIVWWYKGNSEPKKQFPGKHDTILFYSGNNSTFNRITLPYAESTIKRYNHTDEQGRKYKISALRNGKQEIVYMKDGKAADDVWEIPVVRGKEKYNDGGSYPTQKPVKLLERIILASSNPGDLVFDPFCGCATTLVAAQNLGRKWIGCDLSEEATKILKDRLEHNADVIDGVVSTAPTFLVSEEVSGRSKIKNKKAPKPKPRKNRGKVRDEHIHYLFGIHEGICPGCGETPLFKYFEVDHIDPDGGDDISNLQLMCTHCNRTKQKGDMEDLGRCLDNQETKRIRRIEKATTPKCNQKQFAQAARAEASGIRVSSA